jgi:hypothetical protein
MGRPLANYEGQMYGYLKLIRPIGRNKRGNAIWEAVCTYEGCGKLHQLSSDRLARLRRKTPTLHHSRGCYRRQAYHKGEMCGYLELIRRVGRNNRKVIVWEAVCTYEGCGKIHRISSETLSKGAVSCGCYCRKQLQRAWIARYQQQKGEDQ